MLHNYEKLNGLTLLTAWSNEKWINLPEVCEQLGTEKEKTLLRSLPKVQRQMDKIVFQQGHRYF